VHIVILNYKGALDTIECVASIKGTTFSNFEIVVVDNDSATAAKISSAPLIRTSPCCRVVRIWLRWRQHRHPLRFGAWRRLHLDAQQ
jgi:hypothetical protein